MNKNTILLILLSTVAICCAIFVVNKKYLMHKKYTISQIDYYNLTKNELIALKKAVKNGDANAAMKISNYYTFVLNDTKNDLIWLKKAAELGNKNAKEVLPETLKMVGKKLEDIPSPNLD